MRLVFHLANDHYFLSHRLPLALAAMEAGFEVWLVATDTGQMAEVASHGVRTVALRRYDRVGMNPFREVRALAELVGAYRRLRPDVVQHVGLKPILFGNLAARVAGVPRRVNLFAGLGYVFRGTDRRSAVLRRIVTPLLRAVLRDGRTRVMTQHVGDADELVARGIVAREQITVVPGSGVDTARFEPGGVDDKVAPPAVLFGARLLRSKGVGRLVRAGRILHGRGVPFTLWIAGAPDVKNPEAHTQEELDAFAAEPFVELLGRRSDMPDLMRQATVACLPSTYGEGLPLFLLEALAAGLPVVTTDHPGCRDCVLEGITGHLVPPDDDEALADALQDILSDPERASALAARARHDAETRFERSRIHAMTIGLYA